jgi:hypothetical protein
MLLPIRGYLPHLLVGLSISLIMVGAYAAIGLSSLSEPKSIWTINPLTISFSGGAGTGSSGNAEDSFKCAPSVTEVTLRAIVTGLGASKVTLNTSPSSFSSCGPPFNTLTVTAQCLVASCLGTYTGTVVVFQGYTMVPPDLSVTIVVN